MSERYSQFVPPILAVSQQPRDRPTEFTNKRKRQVYQLNSVESHQKLQYAYRTVVRNAYRTVHGICTCTITASFIILQHHAVAAVASIIALQWIEPFHQTKDFPTWQIFTVILQLQNVGEYHQRS